MTKPVTTAFMRKNGALRFTAMCASNNSGGGIGRRAPAGQARRVDQAIHPAELRDSRSHAGLDTSVYRLTLGVLDRHPDIEAVYSIGGGNRAILEAFDARHRPCRAFIAHDLDADNRELLEAGRLSAVLYHDLRRDMHRACQIIMQAHGALDGPIATAPAPTQVITPFNIPPETAA
jgi:ABC-type sugar transport system substrate-binding protein